jgi:hypothetical protein
VRRYTKDEMIQYDDEGSQASGTRVSHKSQGPVSSATPYVARLIASRWRC